MSGPSNTYTFDPANADLVLEAFERIGKRSNQLDAQMLISASMSANLTLVRWSNRGVNLWKMQKFTQALTQGVATYALDASIINLFEVYISTGTPAIDRMITPFGRYDYAAVPDKASQGTVGNYWFQRLIVPQVTLWETPDDGGPYTMNMNAMVRVQDMALTMAQQADMPYRFYDAFCSELAAKLAEKWAPDRLAEKKALATESWKEASGEDRELATVRITPDTSSYYNRQ